MHSRVPNESGERWVGFGSTEYLWSQELNHESPTYVGTRRTERAKFPTNMHSKAVLYHAENRLRTPNGAPIISTQVAPIKTNLEAPAGPPAKLELHPLPEYSSTHSVIAMC